MQIALISTAGHHRLASVEHHLVAAAGAPVHGANAGGIHQLRPADANESGVSELVGEVSHRPANDMLGGAGDLRTKAQSGLEALFKPKGR